jgi:hypothetical protein
MTNEDLKELLARIRREADEAAEKEKALPWQEQTRWRKSVMYEGWELEDILRHLSERAAITRSHNGYAVINTPDLGFIDVDFDVEYDTKPQQAEVMLHLTEWVANHPGQSWRAYRTAHGMRLMRIDAPQPLNAEFDALCASVGADTLYVALCHEQGCYPARISPRPLRVGVTMPRWNPFSGWMFSDPDGKIFPVAIKAYEVIAELYKTCTLIEVVGSGVVHPALTTLVDYHDASRKVHSELPRELLHESETDGPSFRECATFNATYRPEKHAPDDIWAMLSPAVQSVLTMMDDSETLARLHREHKQMRDLAEKWKHIAKQSELDRHARRDNNTLNRLVKQTLDTSKAVQTEYEFSRKNEFVGNLEALLFGLHELGYVQRETTYTDPNKITVSIDMVIDAVHVKEARETLCELAANGS